MPDANTEYNNNNKKSRKIRRLKNFFKNGQEIKHCIDDDIWIGFYDSNNDKIIYKNKEYSSISSFVTAHYTMTSSVQKYHNGWKECEYNNYGSWMPTSIL